MEYYVIVFTKADVEYKETYKCSSKDDAIKEFEIDYGIEGYKLIDVYVL